MQCEQIYEYDELLYDYMERTHRIQQGIKVVDSIPFILIL